MTVDMFVEWATVLLFVPALALSLMPRQWLNRQCWQACTSILNTMRRCPNYWPIQSARIICAPLMTQEGDRLWQTQ